MAFDLRELEVQWGESDLKRIHNSVEDYPGWCISKGGPAGQTCPDAGGWRAAELSGTGPGEERQRCGESPSRAREGSASWGSVGVESVERVEWEA